MSPEFILGDSLLALQKSKAVNDFEGVIRSKIGTEIDELDPTDVERTTWLPKRVVAIDASNLTHTVKNGFPGAEATLLMLSVVFIDISKLAKLDKNTIPSPRIFHEMDSAHTLDAVLPGANIVRGGVDNDTPVEYFRKTVHDTFLGTLDRDHENILQTLREIVGTREGTINCPIIDCQNYYKPGEGEYRCDCPLNKILFETDSLRFHERFNELGSNGEVHGEVRHVLEILSLVNILRYFEDESRLHFLRDCAFVLDGPLAVFGQPAWIAPYVRNEIARISIKLRERYNCDLLVLGIEKSGQYVAHFDLIDWNDKSGPRAKYENGSVLIPSAKYINRNIVRRPEDAKPSGADTYFGRKVFYKTNTGSHTTLNLAMVNSEGRDFQNVSLQAFPRLGDALNILDHLSTYLYHDGFVPLIRAQAHAAIPLKTGAEILSALFQGQA